MLIPQSDLSQWRATCNGEHTRLPFATVAKLFGFPQSAAAAAAASATAAAAAAITSPAGSATTGGTPMHPVSPAFATSSAANSPQTVRVNSSSTAAAATLAQFGPTASSSSISSSCPTGPSPSSGLGGAGAGSSTTFSSAPPTNTNNSNGYIDATLLQPHPTANGRALVAQGEYIFVAVVPQRPAAASAPPAARRNTSVPPNPDSAAAVSDASAASPTAPSTPAFPAGGKAEVTNSAIMVWSRDGTVVTRCVGGHDDDEGPIVEISPIETVGRYHSLFATSTGSSVVVWLVGAMSKPPNAPSQLHHHHHHGHGHGHHHHHRGSGHSSTSRTPPVPALPNANAATTTTAVTGHSNTTSGRATPFHSPHAFAASPGTPNGSVASHNLHHAPGSTPMTLALPSGTAGAAAAAAAAVGVPPYVLCDVAHAALRVRSCDLLQLHQQQLQQYGISSFSFGLGAAGSGGAAGGGSSAAASMAATVMLRTPTLFVPEPSPMQHGGLFATVDVIFFVDRIASVGADSGAGSPTRAVGAAGSIGSAGDLFNDDDDYDGDDEPEVIAPNGAASGNGAARRKERQQQQSPQLRREVVSRCVCRAGVGLALPCVNDPPWVQFEKPIEVLQEDRLSTRVVTSASPEGTSRAALPLMAVMPPLFAFSVSNDRIVTAPPDSCSTTPSWTPCEDCPEAPLLSMSWLPMPSFVVYGSGAGAGSSGMSDTSNAATPSSTAHGSSSGNNQSLTTGVSQYKRLVCATATRIIICRVGAGGQPEKLQKIVNGGDGVFFRRVSCSFEGKIWIEYAAPHNVRLWRQSMQQRMLKRRQERAQSDNQTPFGQGFTAGLAAADDDDDAGASTAAALSASVISAASPANAPGAIAPLVALTQQQRLILQAMQATFAAELTCVVLPIHVEAGGGAAAAAATTVGGGGAPFGRFGFGSNGEVVSTALRIADRPSRIPNSPFTMVSVFQQKFSPTHVGPQMLVYDAVRRRLSISSLQSFVEATQVLPAATVIPRHMKFGPSVSSTPASLPTAGGKDGDAAGPGSGDRTATAPKQKFKFGPFAPVPVSGPAPGKSAFGAPPSQNADSAAAPAPATAPAPAKTWKFGSAAPPSASSAASNAASSASTSQSVTPAQPKPGAAVALSSAAAAEAVPVASPSVPLSHNATPFVLGGGGGGRAFMMPPAPTSEIVAEMVAAPSADVLFGSDLPIATNPEADSARFGHSKSTPASLGALLAPAAASQAEREASSAAAAAAVLQLLRAKALLSEEALLSLAGGEEAVLRDVAAIIRSIVK